ncbi:hypothetical protein [Bacillus sp. TH30]|nr:hypothetical protein [Bacillus sp. TH30]MBK5424533.1 hypothetical protein [Bacillus sp. TH30]
MKQKISFYHYFCGDLFAWLAWLPNLIIAELFIRQSLNKEQQQKNTDLHF